MKTFTKILTAAAATALLATGCVNEDPAYKNNEPGTPPDPNAKGYLTLADMSMRVVVDTDTETRPDDTSDETAKPQTRTDEAQPDVDTFIIEIRDATGKLALQETYGDLKVSIGEAGRLELPVGGYTMEVRSEEAATTPAAEWEHPVYFGSQEFVIEKNQTTPINEVVCTLNNIKVTLMCSKDLADQLTADTKSTVTLGETTMTFLKDETRAAYFMPQGETNTLKLHLEGAFADTPDAPVRINKSISGVKAGQWRKLSIVITYSDKGDIKLDIDVNDFMEDDEIPVNDPDNPGEPGLPVAPTLECPGYDLTKPFQLLASMFDAQGNYTRPFAFNLASSNGIGSFAVKITSDNSRLTGMVSGIGGPEFDMDQPQDFIPGTTSPKRYMITTMAAVKSVVIGIGDDSYEALNGTTEGVEVTRESDLSLTVTLSDAFFAGRPGGSHPVSIRVTDSAGAEATAISEYRLQGLLPIEKTDYDLWTNSLTLRALVLDPNVTTATFGLRVKDGEWSDAEGVNAGEGIYTATFTAQWKESVNAAGLTVHTPVAGTGVFAGNSYEARAALDGETVSSAEFQAAAGQVIPDGDMESGSLPCFGKSTSESTTFWGSGNAATSRLCAQSTKPGMGGSYCAKLESQPAFGLLAAGNLFSATFRFASLSGTASFGMPYQWTARPTALRLKYHATVGAVNKGTVTEEHEYIQDGQDRSRIFAVIVDWNSRHATVAGMGSPTGVWDPAKTAETAEGPVIAYGSLLIGETTPGDAMTTVEIPIEYYDRTTKPTGAYTLVISCTTSAYGDFKVGCLGNVMYVDDFEWVY